MQVNLAALRSQDVQTTCLTSPSIVTIQRMLTQYLQLSLQLFLFGLSQEADAHCLQRTTSALVSWDISLPFSETFCLLCLHDQRPSCRDHAVPDGEVKEYNQVRSHACQPQKVTFPTVKACQIRKCGHVPSCGE